MVKTNLLPTLTNSNALSGAAGDIRALKGPVVIPSAWWWVWCGLAILLAAWAVWWLWRRRSQPKPAPAAPVIPPHRKALAKLEQALRLIHEPGPFCTAVSGTVRVYLEERFQLHAPERTTEEFLAELQSSPLLSVEQKRSLGDFLTACDLVKFARYEPAQTELQGLYDAAVRLVEETQTPSAPSSPAPSSASAPAAP